MILHVDGLTALNNGYMRAAINLTPRLKVLAPARPVLMLPDLGIPNPPTQNPTAPGDPLFNYLFERLLDTFVLGDVGPKTLLWLALPTHDTWFSGWFGIPHGLTWPMVNKMACKFKRISTMEFFPRLVLSQATFIPGITEFFLMAMI